MASTNDSKSFCRGSNPLVPAIIGASPSGKAADSDSAYQWFESTSPCHYGHVAEWLKANCICSCVETDWKSVHPPGVRILSCPTQFATLAQWGVQLFCKQLVVGSSPTGSTIMAHQLRRLEQTTHNRRVLGSSPRWATIYLNPQLSRQSSRLLIYWSWVRIPQGSPFRILRLMVRTLPFHGNNTGSNPVGFTNSWRNNV